MRSEVNAPGEAAPTLVVRLRPQSLLDQGALRTLLRRELLHVADMLDPAFGYLKELPSVDTDPAVLNLLRLAALPARQSLARPALCGPGRERPSFGPGVALASQRTCSRDRGA